MPAFSPAVLPSFPDLRAQLGAQVDFLDHVSRHTVDTVRQLSELNLRSTRRMLDDGFRLGRALAGCNDLFQMGPVTLREAPALAEGWRSWHGALVGVLVSGGAGFARDANDGGWLAACGSGDMGGTAGNAGGATYHSGAASEDVGAAHNPT